METNVSKIKFSDGDILKFTKSNEILYGIYVGNDMVAYSEKKIDLSKKFRKKAVSNKLSTIRLDEINYVDPKRQASIVQPKDLFATSYFQRLDSPEEISKKALLKSDSKTSLNSLEFVHSCCYSYRMDVFMMAVLAVICVELYFILPSNTIELLKEFIHTIVMLMLRNSDTLLATCFSLAYVFLIITIHTTSLINAPEQQKSQNTPANNRTCVSPQRSKLKLNQPTDIYIRLAAPSERAEQNHNTNAPTKFREKLHAAKTTWRSLRKEEDHEYPVSEGAECDPHRSKAVYKKNQGFA